MEFRSTNFIGGGMHLQGDLVTNVSSNGSPSPSSHGVQLLGGSTGGVVTAAGDETNIALNVRAKGSGPLNLGSTTSGVNIQSSGISYGSASTTFLAMIQQYRVDYTLPAVSSAGAAGASADSTVTVTGLTTNGYLLVGQTQRWNSTTDPGIIVTVRCSTTNELKVTTHNIGASSLSGSTVSFNLLQFRP